MGIISSSVSYLLYLAEKFTACIAVTALVICLIVTLIITMGMGVGLGYNYCFVDFKTKYKQIAPRYRFPPRGYYKPNYFNTYHKELLGQKPSWNYYDEHDYNGRRNPHLDFSHRQGDDYGYAKAYPYQDYQNNLQDEREATLPNLSGDDLDNITSTMSTASDNFNITASLLLHETATSTNDTLINVPLETKSTLSSNTTEVSRTTDNVTNNEETTKKVVIDDGEGVTIIFKRSKRSPIMIGLLSRLRAEKVNYSLPIVT